MEGFVYAFRLAASNLLERCPEVIALPSVEPSESTVYVRVCDGPRNSVSGLALSLYECDEVTLYKLWKREQSVLFPKSVAGFLTSWFPADQSRCSPVTVPIW